MGSVGQWLGAGLVLAAFAFLGRALRRERRARAQEAREGQARLDALTREMGERGNRLQESEARIQSFFRHAPAALAVKGLDGSLLLFNRRAETLLGRCGAATPDRTMDRLFPEAWVARAREQDEQVLARGEEVQVEEQLTMADGSVRDYLVHKFPLMDGAAHCWGLGVIVTNITERKQIELVRTERRIQASLGKIAHDFNNVLAAMMGTVELARMDEGPRPLLQSLEDLIGRGTDLVSQVLAWAGREIPVPQPPPAAAQEGLPYRGSGTVLVVDDEEAIRAAAVGGLRHLGFEPLEARDGVEALEVFEANWERIRVILLDLTMPRMGGVETYRALRRAGAMAPIILTSGYGQEEALQRFRSMALAGFLQKPYRFKALARAIRGALEGMEATPGQARTLVAWIPEYETGHALLDAQHKGLVRAFNHLVAVTEAGGDPAEGEKALAQLVEATRSHFLSEEDLMARANFPFRREHRARHQRLTREIEDLAVRIHKGTATFSPEVYNYLEDWLFSHIQLEVMNLSRYLA